MPSRQTLLVIDDEPNIRYSIRTVFSSDSLSVIEASTAREGIRLVEKETPSLVLLDVRLPDMSGLEAFDRIHAVDPLVPVIMMTAFARTETAIEAMQRGAYEYFVKPVDFDVLKQAVDRGLEVSRLNRVPAVFESNEQDVSRVDQIIGDSPAMQDVYKSIGRVASQDVTVLLLGESGTGKELVARAIYHYSTRNKKPFLAVNCAALPESLLESELFGHEKGAFTGADQRRIGKFEQVNGGTIFLDEIGDMSPATQAKALRLLQQQQFERIGGTNTIQTDVRIIAATNKDLAKMVAEGTFREDLYYRLNGFTIRLPSLRERADDIPKLIEYLIRVVSADLGKPVLQVSTDAKRVLQSHSWPGNVRELLSAIRYAVVKSTSGVITVDCLPPSCVKDDELFGTSENSEPRSNRFDLIAEVRNLIESGSNDIYRELIHAVDAIVIDEVLRATQGNQQLAAERLGISRMTLRAKCRAMSHEEDQKHL